MIVGWYAVSVLDPSLVQKYDLGFPYRQQQYQSEDVENGTLYTTAWRRQLSSGIPSGLNVFEVHCKVRNYILNDSFFDLELFIRLEALSH